MLFTPPRSKERLRDRILAVLAGLIEHRPREILIFALLLSLSGGALSFFKLHLDADTNSLIGAQRPFMQTYQAYLDRFGDLEAIYVVVDAGETIESERAQRAVDSLTDALKKIPELRSVRARITPEEQWRLTGHAMSHSRLDDLILTAPAIESLLGTDGAEKLVAFANRNLVEAMAPIGPDAEERRTFFANAFLILESLTKARQSDGLASRLPTRYLTSSTGRMHFIEIMPEKDYESFAVIDGPLKKIRATIAEALRDHPEMEIGLTGKPVLQADELATSAQDMTRGTVLALIAISILFMLYFRECKRPLLAVLAFLIAFGWTYGAATLIVGRLNLLSMVFMLVLVGAGIDYGIHVLARWREARFTKSASEAISHIMKTAVTGNITGAVTSAGVFFLALATDFQGLRELGIIAGLGLLFCGISMAAVLPALLRLTDHDDVDKGAERGRSESRHARPRSNIQDRTVMALALASVIPVSLVAFQYLHFESNLLELQSEDLESVQWEKALFEDDSSGSWFGAVVVEELADIPAVMERARRHQEIGPIRSALDLVEVPDARRKMALETLASLEGTSQLVTSIQSAENQSALRGELRQASRNLKAMLELGGGSIPPERRDMIQALRIELDDCGAQEITAMTARVEKAREDTRLHLEWLTEGAGQSIRSVLPEALRARFSAEDGAYAVLIQPTENIWAPDAMSDFVSALRSVSPEVTGVPITQHESIREMHHAFLIMAWGSIIVVGLGIWLDFRSAANTLACLLTLGLAMSWTLGGMATFGLSINLANFFAIPILIGLGADSAIHVVHRWRLIRIGEELDFGETLNAVTLTACTTGLGFGTLIFAHHQGLQSLGWVMALGSVSIFAASTIVLPAGLSLFTRSS